MVSERILRVIDGLFDQTEVAVSGGKWGVVRDIATRVLQVEGAPSDAIEDAHHFLEMAADRTLEQAGPRPALRSVPTVGRAPGRELAGPRGIARGAADTLKGKLEDETVMTVSTELLELFYSYASADVGLRDKLITHLASLQRTRQFQIDGWHRGMVELGQDELDEAQRHLDSAKIILLLISPEYLKEQASPDAEVYQALKRAAASEARVVPVILRPVTLSDDDDLLRYKWLPDRDKPVTTWENEDQALAEVVQGIKKLCEDLAGVRITRLGGKGVRSALS